MKRITCCVCDESRRALFADWDDTDRMDLYWSNRLAAYLHPSCLNAYLWQIEKHYGIPAEPYRRLLNFGSIGKVNHDK